MSRHGLYKWVVLSAQVGFLLPAIMAMNEDQNPGTSADSSYNDGGLLSDLPEVQSRLLSRPWEIQWGDYDKRLAGAATPQETETRTQNTFKKQRLVPFRQLLYSLNSFNQNDEDAGNVIPYDETANDLTQPIFDNFRKTGSLYSDENGRMERNGWISKRDSRLFHRPGYVECDLTKITLNTLMEYIQYGRVCGSRVNGFRFGLGGK